VIFGRNFFSSLRESPPTYRQVSGKGCRKRAQRLVPKNDGILDQAEIQEPPCVVPASPTLSIHNMTGDSTGETTGRPRRSLGDHVIVEFQRGDEDGSGPCLLFEGLGRDPSIHRCTAYGALHEPLEGILIKDVETLLPQPLDQ